MSDSTREGVGSSFVEFLLAEPAVGAQRVEIAGGSIIYKPGARADSLFCIHEGQVRTYLAGAADTARLIEILGPGDWFNVEALGELRIASTSAVAVSPSVVWALPVDRVAELLVREPRLALQLVRQLAAKLQTAREDAGRLVSEDCNARLVRTLLEFATSAAATQQKDGAIMLHITHRQLAQAVGAARETVSLALTRLRQQNIVHTGRNRLSFKPDALRAFAARPNHPEPVG